MLQGFVAGVGLAVAALGTIKTFSDHQVDGLDLTGPLLVCVGLTAALTILEWLGSGAGATSPPLRTCVPVVALAAFIFGLVLAYAAANRYPASPISDDGYCRPVLTWHTPKAAHTAAEEAACEPLRRKRMLTLLAGIGTGAVPTIVAALAMHRRRPLPTDAT